MFCFHAVNRKLRPDVKKFYHNAKLALISILSTIIYIVLGAFLFFYLEDCLGKEVDHTYKHSGVNVLHDFCLNVTNFTTTNSSDKSLQNVLHALKELGGKRTNAEGCTMDKRSISKWLEITIATVHTIGYGNTVPHTQIGKIAVIFYSMIGITCTLFQYSYVSKTILYMVKCTIKMFEFQVLKRKSVTYFKAKMLVSILLVFVLIITCAASITNHNDVQDYTWLDSFYFWWITISTIGYGDMRLQLTRYVEKHPEYIFLLFLFTVIGIAMVATTVSAIFDITRRETNRRFSKKISTTTGPTETRRKLTANNSRVPEYCYFCRVRILGAAEDGASLSDVTAQLNRNSYASSNYSNNASYLELRPQKTKVIENSNRADSQRSMKLLSDMEYSEDDDEAFHDNNRRRHHSNQTEEVEEVELQNVSPKMVTSTVATTRSSKL